MQAQQTKELLNETLAYCIEQLELAQKFLRDEKRIEAKIFTLNAKKALQSVPIRLDLIH